ncbi:MAG TPA: TetR family transcriptional regulator [Streptomyces sp.]|uniref:TetR/AcrR family transcriptional regulator n=1 Tax=Streptomyces sp. TaxID=1931 RepID=UPI002D6C3DC7|nr:TetR family transcriptional regulator [Streptomyces sp.]HZG03493.1 TetR family transcriptional regulator [Streptomyces sp.]
MAGLRERKKQQTRRHIADVATGLFLERGFDAVTVSEIAEAAEVSVNTVYNYFPAKEDLFFDREEEVVQRPSRVVRERAPGESAAEALLRTLRRDVTERSADIGMNEGYGRFLRVLRQSPALLARVPRMDRATVDALAATLAEETGAAPDDPVPELVAAQLVILQSVVHRIVGQAALTGGAPEEVARQALRKLDAAEALLSETVLNYARRPAP